MQINNKYQTGNDEPTVFNEKQIWVCPIDEHINPLSADTCPLCGCRREGDTPGVHSGGEGNVNNGERKKTKPKLRIILIAGALIFAIAFPLANTMPTITTAPEPTVAIGDWWSQFPDGLYTGEILDGKRNHQGTMKYFNGDEYTGEWKDDMRNGQGTYTWANGNVYIGEWEDGMMSGQGTYTDSDGDVYTGEFRDNMRNGQGTYTDSYGNVYTGEWKDDKRDGLGTLTYTENDIYDRKAYTGDWKDDAMSGLGTMTWTTGEVYNGEWKNDMCHGQGTYILANGDVFTGEYRNGDPNGKGSVTYAENDEYGRKEFIGEFKDGLFNGQGTMTYTNGTTKTGTWKDGEFVLYTEEILDGKRNRQGTMEYLNGEELKEDDFYYSDSASTENKMGAEFLSSPSSTIITRRGIMCGDSLDSVKAAYGVPAVSYLAMEDNYPCNLVLALSAIPNTYTDEYINDFLHEVVGCTVYAYKCNWNIMPNWLCFILDKNDCVLRIGATSSKWLDSTG